VSPPVDLRGADYIERGLGDHKDLVLMER